jgi:hypothetical protein
MDTRMDKVTVTGVDRAVLHGRLASQEPVVPSAPSSHGSRCDDGTLDLGEAIERVDRLVEGSDRGCVVAVM